MPCSFTQLVLEDNRELGAVNNSSEAPMRLQEQVGPCLGLWEVLKFMLAALDLYFPTHELSSIKWGEQKAVVPHISSAFLSKIVTIAEKL